MAKDKKLERRYSLNVARLNPGKYQDSFEIDGEFFSYFESPLADSGEAKVDLEIDKTNTHMDVNFRVKGQVMIPCDRCGELYPFELDTDYRIIYSFDEDMDFEGEEVMYVSADEPQLNLMQEFYDIINLAIPFRKVPDKSIHLCDPKILAILGLDAEGEPIGSVPQQAEELPEPEEEEIDPRWAALKKLKDLGE
ncbi:MAG: DUF177 domain-containing protein [Bacteroidota bacterium]